MPRAARYLITAAAFVSAPAFDTNWVGVLVASYGASWLAASRAEGKLTTSLAEFTLLGLVAVAGSVLLSNDPTAWLTTFLAIFASVYWILVFLLRLPRIRILDKLVGFVYVRWKMSSEIGDNDTLLRRARFTKNPYVLAGLLGRWWWRRHQCPRQLRVYAPPRSRTAQPESGRAFRLPRPRCRHQHPRRVRGIYPPPSRTIQPESGRTFRPPQPRCRHQCPRRLREYSPTRGGIATREHRGRGAPHRPRRRHQRPQRPREYSPTRGGIATREHRGRDAPHRPRRRRQRSRRPREYSPTRGGITAREHRCGDAPPGPRC